MRREIKIEERTGLAYIPKEVREEGIVGKVPALSNALTITLVKPGAKLKQIRESLLTQLKDLDLRMEIYGEDSTLER